MKVEVYLYNHFEKISYDILKLLENNNITFSVKAYDSDMPLEKVSKDIGKKVKRLPQVIIDGERVGRYYDLVEYLMNKNIINNIGEVQNDKRSAEFKGS